MNITQTQTMRPPCEETPRRCCQDCCPYYSTLHSVCRYYELRARQMAVEPSWLASTIDYKEKVGV